MTFQDLPAEPIIEWGLGLGFTAFITAIIAVWGGLHLRMRTYRYWQEDVDIAFADLQDRAAEVFADLRSEIDVFTPPKDAPFNPFTVIADPAPVGKLAKRAVRVLNERRRIKDQFESLLGICNLAKWFSIAFAGSVLLSTSFYFLFYENSILWISAVVVTAILFAICILIVLGYATLSSLLQSSYEHSKDIPNGTAQ